MYEGGNKVGALRNAGVFEKEGQPHRPFSVIVTTIISIVFTVGMAMFWMGMGAHATDLDEAHLAELLHRLDAQMHFEEADLSMVVTMVVQDPQKGIEKFVIRQFRRDSEQKFLLLVDEPRAQRGQGYLRDGENFWFYDSESRQFVHTSLKETFEGTDARHDDFAQSSYANNYKVVGYTQGVLGKYPVHILDLEAVSNEVPDPFLKIWVAVDSHLLLKEEGYSLTKRLMRTTLVPTYQQVGDAVVPKQVIYIDELLPDKKTQMTLTDVSTEPLDASVFTKAYVERVSR